MEADAGDEERRRGTGSRANNSSGCDDASGAAKSSGAAALNKIFRGLIVLFALALISAVCFMCLAGAQEPPKGSATTFQISGPVRNGKTLLPGVTVTAANTLTGKKYATVSSANGTFQFKGLARGRYVVRLEFMGFAAVTEEVVLNPENSSGKIETQLVLASRQQEQAGDLAAQAA